MKERLKKLIVLPPLPTLLIAVPAYGLVIYVLSHDGVDPAIAYGAYLLSAYGLVITITGVIRCVCCVRMGWRKLLLSKGLWGFFCLYPLMLFCVLFCLRK